MENESKNLISQNIIAYIILIVLEVISMISIIKLGGGIVLTFIAGTIILTLWFLVKFKVVNLDYEDLYDYKLKEMKVEISGQVKKETKNELTYKERNTEDAYSNEEMILYLRNEQEKYTILKESNNPAPIGIIISFLGIFSGIALSILKPDKDVTDLKQWLIVISIVFMAVCINVMMAINQNKKYSMKINLLKIEQENIEKALKTSEINNENREMLKEIEKLMEETKAEVGALIRVFGGLKK